MGKLRTHKEFVVELYKVNPNIDILENYINNRTKIKCRCKIDGYEWSTTPNILMVGKGCPVCGKHKTIRGYTDIWTTNPELAVLLFDPEDGYKYSYMSNVKVDWICPNCGEIVKNKQISSVSRYGLSCPKCSDGISYPEKFMYNVFKQLDIKFEYQYSPKWCKYEFKNKQKIGLYDFYIPSKQIIIEMDGGVGHGNCDTKYLTKEESIEIDNIKDKLAIQNGIKVIRIDCNYGINDKFEYIKSNIIRSKLISIFNFSDINWNIINKEIQKSLIKEVCNYKNLHQNINSFNIGKVFDLSGGTICQYLKIGNTYGWCVYNAKEEQMKHCMKGRKVICLLTNKVYNSIKIASKDTGINSNGISCCCRQKRKYAGKINGNKMVWMYYEDYLKQQNNS